MDASPRSYWSPCSCAGRHCGIGQFPDPCGSQAAVSINRVWEARHASTDRRYSQACVRRTSGLDRVCIQKSGIFARMVSPQDPSLPVELTEVETSAASVAAGGCQAQGRGLDRIGNPVARYWCVLQGAGGSCRTHGAGRVGVSPALFRGGISFPTEFQRDPGDPLSRVPVPQGWTKLRAL